MSLSLKLEQRSENKCELCGENTGLSAITVEPRSGEDYNNNVVVCLKCAQEINSSDNMDSNHLRCLTESIWSQVPAVQALSYRLLNQLSNEGWAQESINMAYLEEDILEWANANASNHKVVHKDSNGNILKTGDSVTLIQDLNVKGANFTAKRGTPVRRIRLVSDNAEHIEGKIEGQQIVILTKYVKKS